nr:hypothetical protein [Navicula tsukamotoi]
MAKMQVENIYYDITLAHPLYSNIPIYNSNIPINNSNIPINFDVDTKVAKIFTLALVGTAVYLIICKPVIAKAVVSNAKPIITKTSLATKMGLYFKQIGCKCKVNLRSGFKGYLESPYFVYITAFAGMFCITYTWAYVTNMTKGMSMFLSYVIGHLVGEGKMHALTDNILRTVLHRNESNYPIPVEDQGQTVKFITFALQNNSLIRIFTP